MFVVAVLDFGGLVCSWFVCLFVRSAGPSGASLDAERRGQTLSPEPRAQPQTELELAAILHSL